MLFFDKVKHIHKFIMYYILINTITIFITLYLFILEKIILFLKTDDRYYKSLSLCKVNWGELHIKIKTT